ncbi:hypothetical protein [Gracilimonas mengyeensis]|uniref:Uncharacterized protein n=1 Tax=Gracilimonas mengyeensis TaxID=1302730 RepID=A0A521EMB0_9BACT|nr:hypothetical protein [Gracilimonas mengyeensis]SMO85044.1 hypothetical protein SAMN06265219_112156 [Gracilimonas mengyeensis]
MCYFDEVISGGNTHYEIAFCRIEISITEGGGGYDEPVPGYDGWDFSGWPDTNTGSGCPDGCAPSGGGPVIFCNAQDINSCDLEEAREIIIESSFEQNPCLSSVYDKAGKSSAYQDILENFDGEFSVAHLVLSGQSNLPDTVNARTYPPQNYLINISFNTNNLYRPSLDVARTLIHEMIHAEMYRKLLSIAQKPNLRYTEYTPEEWLAFAHGLRNNFEGLYHYYYKFRWGIPEGEEPTSAQHEAMADHYRNQIINALTDFDNTKSQSTYEHLSWIGLTNTTAWKNLSSTEQDSIKFRVNKFQLNEPSCQ